MLELQKMYDAFKSEHDTLQSLLHFFILLSELYGKQRDIVTLLVKTTQKYNK